LGRHLSTAEVARLLRLPEARVRELARSALGRASRRGHRYAFSFQDLVVLRAARELLEAGVPAARVRRALEALARKLPGGHSLSGVRIYADGREVAVYAEGGAWQPETGQTLFDFGVDALARQVEALRDAPPAAGGNALLEFERGLALEDEDPEAARRAYARALQLDPGQVDAYVNLGRLVHEAGDAVEAARLYGLALERSPDDPVIHFNLALALEDTAGPAAAARSYERALELDPDFADAHFNLAGLCEQLDRGADALRHYRAYKKLRGS